MVSHILTQQYKIKYSKNYYSYPFTSSSLSLSSKRFLHEYKTKILKSIHPDLFNTETSIIKDTNLKCIQNLNHFYMIYHDIYSKLQFKSSNESGGPSGYIEMTNKQKFPSTYEFQCYIRSPTTTTTSTTTTTKDKHVKVSAIKVTNNSSSGNGSTSSSSSLKQITYTLQIPEGLDMTKHTIFHMKQQGLMSPSSSSLLSRNTDPNKMRKETLTIQLALLRYHMIKFIYQLQIPLLGKDTNNISVNEREYMNNRRIYGNSQVQDDIDNNSSNSSSNSGSSEYSDHMEENGEDQISANIFDSTTFRYDEDFGVSRGSASSSFSHSSFYTSSSNPFHSSSSSSSSSNNNNKKKKSSSSSSKSSSASSSTSTSKMWKLSPKLHDLACEKVIIYEHRLRFSGENIYKNMKNKEVRQAYIMNEITAYITSGHIYTRGLNSQDETAAIETFKDFLYQYGDILNFNKLRWNDIFIVFYDIHESIGPSTTSPFTTSMKKSTHTTSYTHVDSRYNTKNHSTRNDVSVKEDLYRCQQIEGRYIVEIPYPYKKRLIIKILNDNIPQTTWNYVEQYL